MRSGIWILAVTAIVSLNYQAQAAENETETSVRSNRAARRYDRNAALGRYRKLFEQADAKRQQEDNVRHADHRLGSDASRDNNVKQVGAQRRSTQNRSAYRAEYLGRSLGRKIKQVLSSQPDDTVPSLDVKNAPPAAKNEAVASRSVSTGNGSPVVKLKWKLHGDINVGQECECSLIVSNTSRVDAKDVVVDATFPSSVRLVSAKPDPSQSVERLVWDFPQLAAGSTVDIRIRMIPSLPGELATSANVRFTGTSIANFQVEEPRLVVALKGPDQAIVGDPAPHTITVSNPGTGVAENVVVEAIIPEGLEHAKGRELSIGVGSLGPGESRTIRLALAAISGGENIVLVQAHGDANLRQRAASRINIMAPSLDIAIDGPTLRYIKRTGEYTLTVTNDGGAASNNVRVYHEIAEGFEFVKASNGGKADSAGRGVTWYVGHLEAGESVKLNVELVAKAIGEYSHRVRVTSDEGTHQETELKTSVEGSAALVMVVDDRDDPIEIGTGTWIEARVENRGSKAASNMGISIELPTGVQLLDAEGPSDHISENGLLIFKSLEELQPGEKVSYRLRVIGREAGNMRFRARLTSDSIQQPLIVEELTRFYGE